MEVVYACGIVLLLVSFGDIVRSWCSLLMLLLLRVVVPAKLFIDICNHEVQPGTRVSELL